MTKLFQRPEMSDNPQPLGGNEMPRFGGIATFMRLPATSSPEELDVAVVGVPFDIGTSNRPGTRFGPRGIREESVLLRPYNMATRAAPFDSLRIDDMGDVSTWDLEGYRQSNWIGYLSLHNKCSQ